MLHPLNQVKSQFVFNRKKELKRQRSTASQNIKFVKDSKVKSRYESVKKIKNPHMMGPELMLPPNEE